jgi:phosphoribosylformimino-5-aminoimidazole carboxamide ribotide isomerase
MLTIIPAIDLKDGKCVRLCQGRAEDVKVYSENPVDMAKYWVDQGGEYLHVVDLDGAFQGTPMHTRVIEKIAAAIDIPVEVGGGLRTTESIRELIAAGVTRAILGTRACEDPESLVGLVAEFGSHVAVGIDARDGFVQTKGWVETTAIKAEELGQRVAAAGIETIIYTDTSVDGMLTGVNAEAMATMCDAVSCGVVASGGVSSHDDISKLVALGRDNLVGAIVGKALYEKTVQMDKLIEAAAPSA